MANIRDHDNHIIHRRIPPSKFLEALEFSESSYNFGATPEFRSDPRISERPQNFGEICAGPHQKPTSIYCSYGAAIELLGQAFSPND